MKPISTYLLRDDYYHLLYDYLIEWSKFVPMNLEAWFKYRDVYSQQKLPVELVRVVLPTEEGRFTLSVRNVFPVDGSFVEGLRELTRFDHNPNSQSVEAKIIDGSSCCWLKAYGELYHVSIDHDSERSLTWETGGAIAQEPKHIFVMRLDFAVRQKSKFEIKKEI